MPEAKSSWTSFCSQALDWLYPPKCPLCERLSDEVPCRGCREDMKPAEPRWVSESSGPLEFRACVYQYEGRAGQAVRKLKYSRSTSLADWMACEVARLVSDLGDEDWVVPVPIHWSRRNFRGFNQADLLAERVPLAQLHPECLRRIRRTKPQVSLSREQRLTNLKGAFSALPTVEGKSILLVDDVVTTGGTARECARTLREAGAVRVSIVAFAGELL